MGMNFGAMAGSKAVKPTDAKLMNTSLLANMLGNTATSFINSGLSDNNLKYGASKTNELESSVGTGLSLINPAVGAAYSVVNSGFNVLESLVNTGNKYDEYGYNHAKGFQRGLSDFTRNLNPISGVGRALSEGGEGSGVRALLSLTGIGGFVQGAYEQKVALERRKTADSIERSGYEQNKFSYMPNLDV